MPAAVRPIYINGDDELIAALDREIVARQSRERGVKLTRAAVVRQILWETLEPRALDGRAR